MRPRLPAPELGCGSKTASLLSQTPSQWSFLASRQLHPSQGSSPGLSSPHLRLMHRCRSVGVQAGNHASAYHHAIRPAFLHPCGPCPTRYSPASPGSGL